jgi:glutathione peroxidase
MSTTARLARKLGLGELKVWEGNMREALGKSFYDLRANTLDGKPFDLSALEGKVVLISNIASRCGWSNANFDKLVELDSKYRGQLQIMTFPSNEFGKKEPGNADEIREFAKKYGAKFHLMEKTQVNGPQTHAVFKALKQATGTEDIDVTWNYETKFLVSREGDHIERFSNASEPRDLVSFIDRLIGETEPHEEEVRENSDENLTKSPASFVNTG